MSSFAGFYINLDRSQDRRGSVEAHLARAGLGYERFAAVDGLATGRTAEYGVLASHQKLLASQVGLGHHVHVLEDDATLSRYAGSIIEEVISAGTMEHFDLLFLDTCVRPEIRYLQFLKSAYSAAGIVHTAGSATWAQFQVIGYFAGLTSYIANKNSLPRLSGMLAGELALADPDPADIVIRDKAERGELRVGCLFPFVTSIAPGRLRQDIVRKREAMPDLVMDLIRHSFFIECDHAAIAGLTDQELPVSRGPHYAILERAVGFMLTPAFVPG